MSKERAKLNNILEKTIEAEVKECVASVMSENSELNKKVQSLENSVTQLQSSLSDMDNIMFNYKIFDEVLSSIKSRFNALKGTPEQEALIYNFLKSIFEPDFAEDTYECPIWLGACTNFYSNRKLVVEILRCLGIYVPKEIDSFRLPQDWTEEELDIVFDTMGRHYVCNNQIFEGNLRFWKSNALSSVDQACHCRTYSEIPWQFLLRNPNLLNDKYLIKIGKMAWEKDFERGWRYFFKITEYQELSETQIKTIIDNINPYHTVEETKFVTVNLFLLNNIKHVTSKALLDSLYDAYSNSYDFVYNNTVLNMPPEYVNKHVLALNNPIAWIERHKDKLTKEQKNSLLKITLERFLV